MKQAEIDGEERPGISTVDAQRIAELEREVRELRRAQIEQAVATVRRHRAVALGLPKVRPPLPDLRPGRPA